MVAARVVAILVLGGTSVILDSDALNIHSIAARKRSSSISPLAGSLSLWVGLGSDASTSNPVTHSDLHRSLGVVFASKSFRVGEGKSAYSGGTDAPCDLVLGPLDSVSLESSNGISDCVGSTTIIGSCVALSEEIALNCGILGTNPLKINLIKIIRFEDETADNTVSWSSSHHSSDLSEHDVLVVLHNWCIAGLVDVEYSTICTVVLDGSSVGVAPVIRLAVRLCEIICVGTSDSRIIGASWMKVSITSFEEDARNTYFLSKDCSQ